MEVDWKINVFNDKQLDVVLIVDKRRKFPRRFANVITKQDEISNIVVREEKRRPKKKKALDIVKRFNCSQYNQICCLRRI